MYVYTRFIHVIYRYIYIYNINIYQGCSRNHTCRHLACLDKWWLEANKDSTYFAANMENVPAMFCTVHMSPILGYLVWISQKGGFCLSLKLQPGWHWKAVDVKCKSSECFPRPIFQCVNSHRYPPGVLMELAHSPYKGLQHHIKDVLNPYLFRVAIYVYVPKWPNVRSRKQPWHLYYTHTHIYKIIMKLKLI